ncbi:MAG: dCMP deaminase family protein [Candidatus Paceibacterota bacterium]|jgi:dCMP deaminase
MTINKWDLRFMSLAKEVASWSKDTTKVGCCIVYDKNPISMGFNGFPTKTNDEISERHERPLKYLYTVHSEANGLVQAAKNGQKTEGCTMYVTLFPCSNCAGLIVNAGIVRLVCENKPDLNDERWGENWKISYQIFNEANIIIEFIN